MRASTAKQARSTSESESGRTARRGGRTSFGIRPKYAQSCASMAILLTFLLGIGNFALHKAVIESRHPVVMLLPRFLTADGGRASMVAEFVILLAVMLLVAGGHSGWSWAYLAYSASNAVAAWLILSHRT
jgi:hypothetical protein